MTKVRKVIDSNDAVDDVDVDMNDNESIKHRHKTKTIDKPTKTSNENIASLSRRRRIEEEMLRACFAEGMTRSEIYLAMNVSEATLNAIEKRLIANDGQRFLSQSTAHRYYLYCLQQEQCVKDLDFFVGVIHDAIQQWSDDQKANKDSKIQPPNAQAAIIAIRAKSDIFDRVVKTGQEMGIIERRAKELRVSGQINLAALPTDKLKRLLVKRMDDMQKLVKSGKIPTAFTNMLPPRDEDNERTREPESVMDAEFVEND